MGERERPADVVLVGLGGAGGVAAHVLTAAGLDVVALEAGPRIGPADASFDEIRTDTRNWMAGPKARHEVPTWRTDPSEEAGPSPWPVLMMNGVGGSTVHYECVSHRFLPWNFESRTSALERYGAGAIPAGSTLADWPLSYGELESFYDAVEHTIGVSGQAGANHFEGARARDFPMEPLRTTGWAQLMASAGRDLGWHPFPVPAAINSRPYNGNGECTYCGFCQSNSCHAGAKGGTADTVIPMAEATGLLRVETGARVSRIEVGADGLVSGVRYVQDGIERVQPARVVLVGTFTYENVRLLLLSKSRAYPEGLSNNHGQVGEHFIAHITPFVYGRFPGKHLRLYNGTMAQGTCVDDFNADNFDHTGLGFLSGGVFSTWSELKPVAFAGGALPPGIPRWGAAWKGWLREHADSVGGAFAQLDALPYEGNRLDLDPVARDPYGDPVVRVTHALHANERRGAAFLTERLGTWLREAGAAEVWSANPEFVEGRHVYGGTRMGDDPDTSVVDRWGFSHEVPNLGVIGASTFPTAGGHNPTLTLQALTWRTAQRLVDAWDTLPGAAAFGRA
jgi:gluconate 2-dehydrogenase alpha chain